MFSNSGTIVSEVVEQLGTVVKGAASQIAKTPVDLSKSAVSQISSEHIPAGGVPPLQGKTNANAASGAKKPEDDTASIDKMKLVRLRQELHQSYYQDLVNPSAEKPQDALQEEKKDDSLLPELHQDKNKLPSLAVQRQVQKTERFPGTSG